VGKPRLAMAIVNGLKFICKRLSEPQLLQILKQMLTIIGQYGFFSQERKLELFYSAEKFGVHILPTHFYSPVPNTSELCQTLVF